MGAQSRTERRFRDIQKKANNSFMRKNLKKECNAQMVEAHKETTTTCNDFSKNRKVKCTRSKDTFNNLNSPVSHPTSGNAVSSCVEFGKHTTGKNVALKRVSDDKKRLQKGYARLSSQGEGDCALRERYQRGQEKKSRHLDLRRARKGKFDFDVSDLGLGTMSFVSDSKTNEARASRFVKSACNLQSYTVQDAPAVSAEKKAAVSNEVRALVAGIAKKSVKTNQALKRLARQEKKKARRNAKLNASSFKNMNANVTTLAVTQPANCLKKNYDFEVSNDSYDFYSKFPVADNRSSNTNSNIDQYKQHHASSSSSKPVATVDDYEVDYSDVLDREESEIAADQRRVKEMVRRLEVNVFKRLGIDVAKLKKNELVTEFADNDWSYLSGDCDWNDAFVDEEGDWKMLDLFSEEEPADLESPRVDLVDMESPMSVDNMGFVLLNEDY